MKKTTLFSLLFGFMMLGLNAQFVDDMEYEQGEALGPWWICPSPPTGDCIIIVDDFAQSGTRSGYIDPSSVQDQQLDLGNKTSGTWGLEFYMYITSGSTGYFTLLDDVPYQSGTNFILGNIYFNEAGAAPGVGEMDIPTVGTVTWDYPEDAWFQVILNVDLTNGMAQASFEFYIDGVEVVPAGTPLMLSSGGVPTSYGGMDFFSIDANNNVWVDDFQYIEGFPTPTTDFSDTMEYPNGIPEENNWWYCPSGADCEIEISSEQSLSGDYSGYIPDDGTTVQQLYLGNKTFGNNGFEFYMYVPTGKEAAFHIEDAVTSGASESVVGAITFNEGTTQSGMGSVTNSALGAVSFNFPHDQWFRVVGNVDMSLGMSQATWQFVVNGTHVIPSGTSFSNSSGDLPRSLGGISFYSASGDNQAYLDNFNYVNGEIILAVETSSIMDFQLYPNPAQDLLQIQSNQEISSIRLYSLQGVMLKETKGTQTISVFELAQGLYFVELTSGDSKSVRRFVKN